MHGSSYLALSGILHGCVALLGSVYIAMSPKFHNGQDSCRSAPVYAQDGLPVSHKAGGGRHGFGIKSIKKVVKQYGGNLQMYYDNDTGTFHTIITLKDLKQE